MLGRESHLSSASGDIAKLFSQVAVRVYSPSSRVGTFHTVLTDTCMVTLANFVNLDAILVGPSHCAPKTGLPHSFLFPWQSPKPMGGALELAQVEVTSRVVSSPRPLTRWTEADPSLGVAGIQEVLGVLGLEGGWAQSIGTPQTGTGSLDGKSVASKGKRQTLFIARRPDSGPCSVKTLTLSSERTQRPQAYRLSRPKHGF